MAARDRYSVKLECKNCGEKGSMDVSENDYPFMKRLDFSVDAIEGRFDVSGSMETLSSTYVDCGLCGAKVL